MARMTLFLVLAASLAGNVALGLRNFRRAPGPIPEASSHAASAPGTVIATSPSARAPEPVAPSPSTGSAHGTTAASDPPLWTRFETRDPAEFAARLRAAGFSTAAAKAAVRALMMELAEEQRARELAAKPIEPFWKVGQRFNSDREFSRGIMERERRLQALFPEDDAHLWQLRAQYGASLSADKLLQISLLDRDYDELRREVSMRRPNTPQMPWTTDELRVIEQERQRDLAALLTPAELEQFQLRASQTAQTLQRQLGPFQPSEQEYREIYRLRSEFDQRFGQAGFSGPDQAMARRDAQQATDAAIKAFLGEQRFAEYTRSLDPGFQAAYAVTQRHGLGTAAAVAAFEIQQDVQERAGRIRGDRSRTLEQRSADLSALLAETTGKLASVLTEDGMTQYRERASWLRNLERPMNPGFPNPPPR